MNPSVRTGAARRLLPALIAIQPCACVDTAEPARPGDSPPPREVVETALELLSPPDAHPGKRLFSTAFEGSNGRSCATCHVLEQDTTLLPERVEALLAADPQNPLFNRLDADDPAAEVPTFDHLRKGLVRVVLPLADNLDVIDLEGRVITPPERTIAVWRGVPTVANTALTGPYQLDGRQLTLEAQAQAAISGHSEGPEVPAHQLDSIAAFQRQLFSSPRAWIVARLLELGWSLDEIPIPEELMPLSAAERRGREVYDTGCQPCHGSASTDRIVDREAHDLFFSELNPDGNVRFDMVEGAGPVAVPLARPDDEFLNVGFGVASYLGQVGLAPAFNDDVELPRFRLRFYVDATRREALVDLPPIPVTQSGDPLDLRPALDARGAPIVGPNRVPQLFSTDPGRAVLSGDPADFEAFDMPQLRGIARTAPYFHDNSHGTLEEVVDAYSRFVLAAITPLGLPRIHPPETPDGPGETLSVQQKRDLVAFLRRL